MIFLSCPRKSSLSSSCAWSVWSQNGQVPCKRLRETRVTLKSWDSHNLFERNSHCRRKLLKLGTWLPAPCSLGCHLYPTYLSSLSACTFISSRLLDLQEKPLRHRPPRTKSRGLQWSLAQVSWIRSHLKPLLGGTPSPVPSSFGVRLPSSMKERGRKGAWLVDGW